MSLRETKNTFTKTKMIMKKLFVVSLAALSLAACGNKAQNAEQTTDSVMAEVVEVKEIALAKTYKGEIPAADDAVAFIVSLQLEDGKYTLTETPKEGKSKDKAEVTEGTYVREGDMLTLTSKDGEKSLYKVKEGALEMLNSDGESSATPELYTLKAE